jgi:hypothetical protein
MTMTTQNLIDWRRFQQSRELAGEWRLLRAKIRHVVERTCALGEQLAVNDDAADAIDVCASARSITSMATRSASRRSR